LSNPFGLSAHPACVGLQARSTRLGHWTHLGHQARFGSQSCSARLKRQPTRPVFVIGHVWIIRLARPVYVVGLAQSI